MKMSKMIVDTTALTIAGGMANAQDMANTMTIVSWGGAYTESQDQAYHQPFAAITGVTVYNEDKGSAAFAGVRAQIDF